MSEIYNKKGRKARIQSDDTTVRAGKIQVVYLWALFGEALWIFPLKNLTIIVWD
jgi:hypothetical protein